MENQLKELNDLHKKLKTVVTRVEDNLKAINTVERWKVIEGHDNYSVSTHGRVRNDKTKKILKNRTHDMGYYTVYLHSDNLRVHRLVANAFIVNAMNKNCVDHIDNNRKNNHISNLRWSTNSENQMNKSKHSNNTSGVIGVNWSKDHNKWGARISIDRKCKYLGYFDTIEESKEARLKAVKQYYGEYAHSSQKT
jgi:hypothetical protein